MQRLKYKQTAQYQKEGVWDCDICGTQIKFSNSVPYNCPGCKAKTPTITTLLHAHNQDFRVKHFVHGIEAFR